MSLKATGAFFYNIVNPNAGSVVALDILSPSNTGAAVKPPLQQWSDVIWGQFVDAAGPNADLKNKLDWCFRCYVNNQETLETIWAVMKIRDYKILTTYNKEKNIRFTMQEEEGQAIAETLKGAGCAFLIAQHKAQLGVQTITEVVIWADEATRLVDSRGQLNMNGLKDPGLSMYFTIKPYSTDGKVGAREL